MKGTDWIAGAEICERTGWSKATLRRRVAAGRFPPKIDFDGWIRADVEAHLMGTKVVGAEGEGWVVNHEAIDRELAKLKARGKALARRRR